VRIEALHNRWRDWRRRPSERGHAVLPSVSAVESPPFPLEPASADRVRATLVEAVRRHTEALESLESAVCECVRYLRAQGMPPEAPAAIPQHLRDKLYTAQQDHLASTDALRGAVCDYVDELRTRGVPYDDVVRSVGNLMAKLDGKAPRSADATKQNRRTVESMLQWCKERWQQ
jgi:hypothetical protein